MPVDEKTIKRLIQEVLSEMNRQDCNVPIVKENQTFQELDGVSSVVPTWDVVFSCDNPADRNDRHKAKFSVETPPEKSEGEIKVEIARILEQQLGRR
jgi:hypothetical protein